MSRKPNEGTLSKQQFTNLNCVHSGNIWRIAVPTPGAVQEKFVQFKSSIHRPVSLQRSDHPAPWWIQGGPTKCIDILNYLLIDSMRICNVLDSKRIHNVCWYIKLPSGGLKENTLCVKILNCPLVDSKRTTKCACILTQTFCSQVVFWSADTLKIECVDLETAPEVKKNPLGKTSSEPRERNLEVPPAKFWILVWTTRT